MWKYLQVWELLEESLTMNLTKNGDLSNNERTWCWEWSNANSIKPSDFFDKNGEVWFWSEWLSGDRSAACRLSLLRRSEGAKEKNILSKRDYYINISGKICSWKSRIIVDVISNKENWKTALCFLVDKWSKKHWIPLPSSVKLVFMDCYTFVWLCGRISQHILCSFWFWIILNRDLLLPKASE